MDIKKILNSEVEASEITRKNKSCTSEDSQIKKVENLIFIFGVCNKLAFLMVAVSCNDLAKYFDQERYLTLYQGSLVIFSFLVKLIHMRFLLRVLHKIKILFATSFYMIGCLSMILSIISVDFALSIFGSILIGVGFALSDNIMQGFLKAFDSKMIGIFSSGAGLTGIIVCLVYLLLKWGELEIIYAYIFPIPYFIINYFVFIKMVKINGEINKKGFEKQILMEEKQALINENLTLANFGQIFGNQAYYSLIYGGYHFLVYGIFGVFAVEAVRFQKDNDFFSKYGFVILVFEYRLASFLMRSSLKWFRVKKIHYPFGGILVLYVLFFLIAQGWLANLGVLCVGMFLVGGFEGVIYVNVICMILEDERITFSQKEAAFNLNSLFFDLGVLLNTIAGVWYYQQKTQYLKL